MFVKGEHERVFAYSAHTVCDKNNFILHTEVTSGNVHDSLVFDKLFNNITSKYKIDNIVADAGYKTPWICKQCLDNNIMPILPYKRTYSRKGMLNKNAFVYDEYYDCYICPNNEILSYSTTNKEGYREYKSKGITCGICPNLKECTSNKQNVKLITRHIWNEYMEKAEDIRHTEYGRELYKKRSETIERVFGDAKEKHSMRYTQVRGIERVKSTILLTFACMNLKKLAKWKRMEREKYSKKYNLSNIIQKSNTKIQNLYQILYKYKKVIFA